MTRATGLTIGLFTALTAAAGAMPAQAQDRWVPGHWDWSGGRPDDQRPYDLRGPGVGRLVPELRDTRRGRAFVLRNFDRRHDGFLSVDEADAANRAFFDARGPGRGQFDWSVADRGPPPPAPPPPPDEGPSGYGTPGRWDRGAMRAYGFRDTPQGARLTLNEGVLFQTDSATLRPGAVDTLRALADYLRGNAAVRISIDGYTDARGSDAHNLDLSQRRAESVRAAFDRMGVTAARFRVRGHGEADPVASNATPDGMRQNRRVEITLIGRRVNTF